VPFGGAVFINPNMSGAAPQGPAPDRACYLCDIKLPKIENGDHYDEFRNLSYKCTAVKTTQERK
jgi:hypothetical protein